METITYASNPKATSVNVLKNRQRIILLTVLAYEALGCLAGGAMLIAAPDGSYMDMPVHLMRGIFPDFFVPGIILFCLGIITTLAFIQVFRRTSLDWFMASLALGALAVWFYIEIIILNELHWLHLMWGFPVFLGYVVLIPLITFRHNRTVSLDILLTFGIISSVWYVAANFFVPLFYKGYSAASLTVSELSAIGSPTRILWVLVIMLYPAFLTAFGWGVWQSGIQNRTLRSTGTLIIAYAIFNFYWPPMHQRDVIASSGGTLTDTLHIIWAMITLLLMTLMMIFGAAAAGSKTFRIYTGASMLAFIIFGILTMTEFPGIEANLPTPHIGIWERINIGVFLLWIVVFSIILDRKLLTSKNNA